MKVRRSRITGDVTQLIVFALFSVAILLAAYFAIGEARQSVRSAEISQAHDAQDAYDTAHKQIGRYCLPLSSTDRGECERQVQDSYRDYRQQSRDLVAQRATATWTAYMGAAALIGMAVSIIGVGLVWFTFRESRRAAKSASDTYAAFVAVERSRLVIVPSGLSHSPKDGNRCAVSVSATNVGKGTCVVTRLGYKFVETSEFSKVKGYVGSPDSRITIEPNQTKCLIDWAECKDGRETPFIRGVVTYEDAFSERKSFFCFRIYIDHAQTFSGERVWWTEERDPAQPENT